jgi:hypothetical protein
LLAVFPAGIGAKADEKAIVKNEPLGGWLREGRQTQLAG